MELIACRLALKHGLVSHSRNSNDQDTGGIGTLKDVSKMKNRKLTERIKKQTQLMINYLSKIKNQKPMERIKKQTQLMINYLIEAPRERPMCYGKA